MQIALMLISPALVSWLQEAFNVCLKTFALPFNLSLLTLRCSLSCFRHCGLEWLFKTPNSMVQDFLAGLRLAQKRCRARKGLIAK